jgi:hypothetical protein
MYQPIEEEISVAGIFSQGKFEPKKFLWKQKIYPITEITLTARSRDGQVQLQHYSVLSHGNLYRLMYNQTTQHWKLAEIWCDG